MTTSPKRSRRWPITVRLAAFFAGVNFLGGALLIGLIVVMALNVLNWVEIEPPRLPEFDGAPSDLAPPDISTVMEAVAAQEATDRRRLLVAAGNGLVLMTAASAALGWWMARRAVRPIRMVSTTAKEISEQDLHRRIALAGPQDEVTDLADTIDDLLARLERAFTAQRQFVANASHELRTPLAYERSVVEVALADPTATIGDLRECCEQVLAGNAQQEKVIDALLTLAKSQRGLERHETVDLSSLVADDLDSHGVEPAEPTVETALDPATIKGDPALLRQLVGNVVRNAYVHNVAGGWVRVATHTADGIAQLRVTNSGPQISPGDIERIFEPFQRLDAARTGHSSGGLGIGLSIVAAIAEAHGAQVRAEPGPEGGLDLTIGFGSPATASGASPGLGPPTVIST
jgi:signal transduction histidine kinase